LAKGRCRVVYISAPSHTLPHKASPHTLRKSKLGGKSHCQLTFTHQAHESETGLPIERTETSTDIPGIGD
jgi:hypothetical protein